MANLNFSLASGLQIGNSAVQGNGTYTVWTSNVQNNPNDLSSMRVIIDYSSPNPSAINITAIVESSQDGNWFPICYQFTPFTDSGNGPKRILVMQPDILSINSGIDDDTYIGDSVVARTSRFQGKVGANFRVRLVVYENNYGLANSFQNVTVNVYGELY